MVKCPEDPIALMGKPIGMYHCPYCGCMQIAGLSHICDSDDCLLEDCDCQPPGRSRSPNLQAWIEKAARDDPESPSGEPTKPEGSEGSNVGQTG